MTPPVGVAGRSGSPASVGDWNDSDAGVDPSFLTIELRARHIIADSMRDRLYATIPGDAPNYPNRLLSIDAKTGKVVRDIPVGSEPTTLALSDDGSTLWVSIAGAASLLRVTIAGDELMPADAPNPLPTMCFDKPCIAGAMVVLPGTTDRVLAAVKGSLGDQNWTSVLLVENGETRASLTSPQVSGVTAVCAGPNGYAFGFNGSNSGFDFYVFSVSDKGELTRTVHSGLVSGYGTELTYRDGRVFATSGDVLDVTTPTSPARLGRFAKPAAMLPLPNHAGALTVSIPEVFGGSNMGIPVTLNLVSTESFTITKSAVIGTVTADAFMQPRNLVQVGSGLAFLTGRLYEESNVYLLHDVPELQSQ